MNTARDPSDSTIPATASDAAEAIATAETAPGLGLVPGHKRQLRERVGTRLGELTQALLQLGRDPAYGTRVQAIETALQGLEAHVGGGWESVGAVEAAQLARWLETTRLLITESATTPSPGAAAPAPPGDSAPEGADDATEKDPGSGCSAEAR